MSGGSVGGGVGETTGLSSIRAVGESSGTTEGAGTGTEDDQSQAE